jgi:hypothetical protein
VKSVSVGRYEEWIRDSDHMPLEVEIQDLAS